MKNKAFLPLLEQLCMIAFFAVAAALCLRGFVLANTISENRQIKDRAVVEAQNAAEVIKAVRYDADAAAARMSFEKTDDGTLCIRYNENWESTDDPQATCFTLYAKRTESNAAGLGTAEITVLHRDKTVFSITTSWQEVSYEEKP